jgi:hypothetical protein
MATAGSQREVVGRTCSDAAPEHIQECTVQRTRPDVLSSYEALPSNPLTAQAASRC